jgi:predicted nucleotidyltransferase
VVTALLSAGGVTTSQQQLAVGLLERLLARHVDVVRLREDMNPRLKKRIMQEARYV